MVPIVMDGDAKDTGLVTTEVTDGSTWGTYVCIVSIIVLFNVQ